MSSDRYTSGDYLQENPTWHTQDSAWKAGQIMRMLARNNISAATVCEVGCGAGEILVQLHQRLPQHVRFTGFEISPQAHGLCKHRARERLEFQFADLLKRTDAPFDLLLVIDVFEHVEDCFGFIRGLRNKADLKMFHIPLDMSIQKVIRKKSIMRLREQLGHVHYFMKETALATLRDCGYEIVDSFYTAGDIDLAPQSTLASMARLPRRMLFSLHQDFAVHLLGGFSLMVLAR